MESILKQDVNLNFEVLIGDDSSTDGTSDICEKFALKHSNVFHIKRMKNIGMINNYIDIIKKTKGLFISQCAGDDYWIDIFKLQKQVDFLQHDSSFGLVHTDYKVLKKNKITKSNGIVPSKNIFDNLLNFNFICAPTIMIKKSILIDAINKNIINRYTVIEDYTLWLYTAQFYKIGYLKDTTCVYRVNTNSLSHFTDESKKNKFIDHMIKLQILFAKNNNKVFILEERIKKYYHHKIYESINKRATFNINSGLFNLIKIRSLNFYYIKYYVFHFFPINYCYRFFRNKHGKG